MIAIYEKRLVYLSLLTAGPIALALWQDCTSVGQHLVKETTDLMIGEEKRTWLRSHNALGGMLS